MRRDRSFLVQWKWYRRRRRFFRGASWLHFVRTKFTSLISQSVLTVRLSRLGTLKTFYETLERVGGRQWWQLWLTRMYSYNLWFYYFYLSILDAIFFSIKNVQFKHSVWIYTCASRGDAFCRCIHICIAPRSTFFINWQGIRILCCSWYTYILEYFYIFTFERCAGNQSNWDKKLLNEGKLFKKMGKSMICMYDIIYIYNT